MWRRLILVSALLAATAAHGQELAPLQGQTVTLGEISGVTYYIVGPEGYRVVATFSDTHGVTTRFIATLQPEQSMTVSVPRGVGEAALEAVFTRHDDRLIITGGAPPKAASAYAPTASQVRESPARALAASD